MLRRHVRLHRLSIPSHRSRPGILASLTSIYPRFPDKVTYLRV
ncbi:hypothetical protein BN903_175 [Halorubrum sp. AJ67]|nr:hypothetical protein BN903_175 [Halorubrum sp. AJ67]